MDTAAQEQHNLEVLDRLIALAERLVAATAPFPTDDDGTELCHHGLQLASCRGITFHSANDGDEGF